METNEFNGRTAPQPRIIDISKKYLIDLLVAGNYVQRWHAAEASDRAGVAGGRRPVAMRSDNPAMYAEVLGAATINARIAFSRNLTDVENLGDGIRLHLRPGGNRDYEALVGAIVTRWLLLIVEQLVNGVDLREELLSLEDRARAASRCIEKF